MTTIQPLSKAAERLLIDALGETADLVSAGMSPNDAIAKTASDRQIPRGHIQLMVNAYNTGRTETQRKSGADALEKAAEFELADADTITEAMFPKTTKTAAQIRRDEAVDASYQSPPHFLDAREQREKRAEREQVPWFEKIAEHTPPEADLGRTAKRAFAEKESNQRKLDEARGLAQNLFDKVNASLEKLAMFLKTSDAPNFYEVKENAEFLFGQKATRVFDFLGEKHRPLSKQAAISASKRLSASEAPYPLIKEVLDLSEDYFKAKDLFEKISAAVARREVEIFRPFDQSRSGVLGESFKEKRAFFFGGLAGTAAGATAGRLMADQLFDKKDKLLTGIANKVNDPQHDMALGNLQTESMLNDLMANDEVISTHDPNEILSHFNELSQLAPRAAANSGLTRSILRKRLQQGALDPYEIDLLLKIENSLRMRDSGTAQGVMQNASPGAL